MKLSDDKKDIILRVYETEGKKTLTKIKLEVFVNSIQRIHALQLEVEV